MVILCLSILTLLKTWQIVFQVGSTIYSTINSGMWFHQLLLLSEFLILIILLLSNSFRPPGLRGVDPRLPCLSLSPGVCSNSCPSSQWYHPNVSPSVTSFSSCSQSFPASGSFPESLLFASGGQSIGASASVIVLFKSVSLLIFCLVFLYIIESGEFKASTFIVSPFNCQLLSHAFWGFVIGFSVILFSAAPQSIPFWAWAVCLWSCTCLDPWLAFSRLSVVSLCLSIHPKLCDLFSSRICLWLIQSFH